MTCLPFPPRGRYTVAVRALGDGAAYADSDWAEFVYVITAGQEEPEVVPTAGLAYSLMPGGKSWEVSRGKADLRGTVVIPDYYEGLPVVRVADEGFGGDGTLDSFRNTVTTGVALPETLVEIGDYAFGNCTALKEIVIPDGVVSLGRGVFDEDEDLLRAVLPSSLSEIPDRLFFGCTALYDVSIPATAAVKVIGGGAFIGCEDLTSVEIPSSVESIGAGAFANCSGLTAIELPASVTSIGASAFANCSGLTAIELPAAVESIGARAFANCSGISSFTVPAGVTRLESNLFDGCSSLSENNVSCAGKLCRRSRIPRHRLAGAPAGAGLSRGQRPRGISRLRARRRRGCRAFRHRHLAGGLCGYKRPFRHH